MKESSLLGIISKVAEHLGVVVEEKERCLFSLYCQQLIIWNEKINLVSRRNTEGVLRKNFVDSLIILPYLSVRTSTLLDIGTGGGFPGIPLKILCPTLQVTLVESSRKKVSFLKHVVSYLGLKGIEIIHARAEDLHREERLLYTFDVVISQAAFKLVDFLRIAEPFLSSYGRLMAIKGREREEEKRELKEMARQKGLVLTAAREVVVPGIPGVRRVLLYDRGRGKEGKNVPPSRC